MSILAGYLEMFRVVGLSARFRAKYCLYRVMSCCFKFESCNVPEPFYVLL
jgi:hypothetical protein